MYHLLRTSEEQLDHTRICSLTEGIKSSPLLKLICVDEHSDFFWENYGNYVNGRIEIRQSAIFNIWCSDNECTIMLFPDSFSEIPKCTMKVIIDDSDSWIFEVESRIWNFIREHNSFFVTCPREHTPSPSPESGADFHRTPSSYYIDYNKGYVPPNPQLNPIPPYRNTHNRKPCDECDQNDCYHCEEPRCPCVRNKCYGIMRDLKCNLPLYNTDYSPNDIEQCHTHFIIILGPFTLTIYVPEELNQEKTIYVGIYSSPSFQNQTFLKLVKSDDIDNTADEIKIILKKIMESLEFQSTPTLTHAPATASTPAPAPTPVSTPAPAPAPAPAPQKSKKAHSCTIC